MIDSKCEYCNKSLVPDEEDKDDLFTDCDIEHPNLHHHCMLRLLEC